MPAQAGGSLVQAEGRILGSSLIGQNFEGDEWFHPRPSATSAAPYDASSSAAPQQGPTSAALLNAIKERLGDDRDVPADAVTASGSGLDPHVSPANARRQIERVARARNLPATQVAGLVEQFVEDREFGLLGEPRVNVLRLNMALQTLR